MTIMTLSRSASMSRLASKGCGARGGASFTTRAGLLLTIVPVLLWANAASAELRDYTVRWLPSASAGIEGYELSVGTASGERDSMIDLGLPGQQNGELRFPMELEGSVDLYLSLRAYGGGQVSPYSNEIVVAKLDAPPDVPEFGVSDIEGATGVVSGAIVVVAATYGPVESVKFVLDGVSQRIENVVPWALAGDSGEPGTEKAFDTTTLADGEHTLSAIPYSQDAAGGIEGIAKSVTFHVDNSLDQTPAPAPGPAPSPSPSPSPEPSPSPGPVDGPEGAVAGLFATAEGDIVALRVDGSTTTLTRNAHAVGGDLRPVWCDLDGDEDRDLVVGFGPGSGGQVLVLLMEDLAVVEEQILVTGWQKYQDRNGETYPGCGDVDGDQRNELAIGLGAGSYASIIMLDDLDSGFNPLRPGDRDQLISLFNYSDLGLAYLNNGAAKPVLGDVDGDGLDEIVVGRSEGARGTVTIIDDALAGYSMMAELGDSSSTIKVIPKSAKKASKGASKIAVGDVDGDGLAEIVLGIGDGVSSRLLVYDDAMRGFKVLAESSDGFEFGHEDEEALSGLLKPSLADIDGDGLPEVALGFGEGGEGQILLLDDMLTDFAPLAWTGNDQGVVLAPTGTGRVSSALETNSR